MSLFILGTNIASNVGYFLSGINDLLELTLSLFLLITAISTVSILVDLIWNMRQLFEFIDNVEDIVERSKFKLAIFLNFSLIGFVDSKDW